MSDQPRSSSVGDGPALTTAEVVADAVTSVRGVVSTHSGMFGEVGTYLPGMRIPGIRIDGDTVEVHVAVAYGTDLSDIAAAIRSRVSALTSARVVDVCVEDIVAPQSIPAGHDDPHANPDQ